MPAATAPLQISAECRRRGERLHELQEEISRTNLQVAPKRLYHEVMHATRRPRYLVKVAAAVRRWGALAERLAGVPVREQFRRAWIGYCEAELQPEEFYRYQCYRFEDPRDAVAFVSMRSNMRLRDRIYRQEKLDESRLADKPRFYRTCAAEGLPCSPTVVEFGGGRVEWWPGTEGRLPARDLFSKRSDRLCGEGAARWIHRDGRWRGEDGATFDGPGLVEHFAALSRTEPFLLQRRMTNHPALLDLGPEALCTVRVVTIRMPDGEPEHLLSIFRMPSAGSPADNFAAGGLAAMVEPDDGTLAPAAKKAVEEAMRGSVHEIHPDTGARIAGRVLPDWEQVIPLCLRAHGIFAEFPSIGWDVALTDEGPMLLEGNYNWDVVLAQQPGPTPLAETRYAESVIAYLDRAASSAQAAGIAAAVHR